MTCPVCLGPMNRYSSRAKYCFRCYGAVLPLQNAAYSEMRKAIRAGSLAHPSSLYCVDCGRFAAAYDHRDYFKPTAVEPVCGRCNLLRGHAEQFSPGAIEHIDLRLEGEGRAQ